MNKLNNYIFYSLVIFGSLSSINLTHANLYTNPNPPEPYATMDPAYGLFGSAPVEPNSQIFPDQTEANNLYWNEVQNMEQQGD